MKPRIFMLNGKWIVTICVYTLPETRARIFSIDGEGKTIKEAWEKAFPKKSQLAKIMGFFK